MSGERIEVGQVWRDTDKGIDYRVAWVGKKKAHFVARRRAFDIKASVWIDRVLESEQFVRVTAPTSGDRSELPEGEARKAPGGKR